MVISETIICQRFVQNAWKKDLCSNCFKSKEDHAVIPEKKITYRWTSHVNNFPQHGILKDRQKNGKEKSRSVSFLQEESEVIGFGGEEYSSDDDDYPVYQENVACEPDNEDEDKEFRKLTKSNTDFNSVPANLKNERCAAEPQNGKNSYADLKFGMPVVDAEGRRQTLQVTIEPFRNSVVVNGVCNGDAKSPASKSLVNNYLRNDKTEKSDETKKIANRTNGTSAAAQERCGVAKSEECSVEVDKGGTCADVVKEEDGGSTCKSNGDLSTGCDSEKLTGADRVSEESVNVLNVCLKEAEKDTKNVFVKGVCNVTEESKYTKVSTVVVDGSLSGVDQTTIESVIDSRSSGEPKPKTGRDDPSPPDSRPKCAALRPFSSALEHESPADKERRPCSKSKDCPPITLPPLMVCKPLDIEFDTPGSREMVGEPDGKADSDDSSDPPPSMAHAAAPALPTPIAATPAIIDSSIYVNPQRSFLHDFSDGKPKQSPKPVTAAAAVVVAANETPKKANACKESPETTMNCLPCTPKLQIPITCNGTGSVKRQAPKPPSPKIIAPSPLFTAPVPLEDSLTPVCSLSNTLERPTSTCESPLVSGQRDAISFLTGDPCPNTIRRKLNLDAVAPPNRNSLNVCVSPSPNGADSLHRYSTFTGAAENTFFMRKDSDTSSICSVDRRSPSKCSRSLSCDSIIAPSVVSSLPAEKTRKYSVATIKVKSKLRKLLRFNNKEDEKFEIGSAPDTPRKRIEIIHPLDLNKSTIEILGSNASNLTNCASDAKKKTEIENAEVNVVSATACPAVYATCPAARPTKPPPPPRAQSLDQKYSEISRPVRPPPPKCGTLKPSPSPSLSSANRTSNLYENIGQSRNGIAPAKPQRAASIRERTRQIVSVTSVEESFASFAIDREAVPECDRNPQQMVQVSDSPTAPSTPYCGSETESDTYDTSNACKHNSDRTSKGQMHRSLEDNYGAVVISNHNALSQLFERVSEATLIPTSLKVLQTTLHIRFEHLTIDEDTRIVVADWHFFNALWNDQKVVVSVSARHFGPMRSLPSTIALYPLIKFNDVIPSRILNGDASEDAKTNAHITVWNEEYVESIDSFCSSVDTNSKDECGLFLTQLANILMHLQNGGVNNVSLEEVFICKRETLVQPKLLVLPFNVDTVSSASNNDDRNRMTLCDCVFTLADKLLPTQLITQAIKSIIDDRRSNALAEIKAVLEYWLWGPSDTTISGHRTTSLQRWLDLERATCLHKMICKSPSEINLHEMCHTMFLVKTSAKTLTEASFAFESQS